MYMVMQPLGGLNDTLCTIHRCYQYCSEYKRKLIIHTAHVSEPVIFADGIENYLCSKQEHVIVGLPVIPTVRETVAGYVDQDADGSPWKLPLSEIKTIRRLDRGYHDKVVIYQGFGGGNIAIEVFGYLDLHPNLKSYIRKKIETLPREYHAIHFRHTDYKSDMDQLRHLIRNLSEDGKPIYLATDNGNVLKQMKEEFGGSLINLQSRLSEDSKPIHHSQLGRERDVSFDIFVDLAVLAYANTLHCPRLSNPSDPRIDISGFCILAQSLRKSDKRTLGSLLTGGVE